jgi:hypothetical protein
MAATARITGSGGGSGSGSGSGSEGERLGRPGGLRDRPRLHPRDRRAAGRARLGGAGLKAEARALETIDDWASGIADAPARD